MLRVTGAYRITRLGGEEVRAFIPTPLPPVEPPLVLDPTLAGSLNAATTALRQLWVAGDMVPSPE